MLPLIFLMAFPAIGSAGAWQRHVMTAKDDRFDTPQSHPLAYFTQCPMLREEDGDFCYLCSPEKRLAEAKKHSMPTELKLVGTIKGFAIYDLFVRFEAGGGLAWKSILVKTGKDRYREIYHCEPTQIDAYAGSSFLVSVGGEQLLGAVYMIGGNKGSYSDDYYWFDRGGAHWVDFSGVRKAARAVLPGGKTLWGGGDENGPRTMAKGMFKFRVQDSGDWLCCSPGAVIVKFRIDRGRVVITDATFDPRTEPDDPTPRK